MIDVSVIIPCYNVEEYLHQCLDSVLANDTQAMEVICINDGSRDATSTILHEYAEKDQRLKVIDKENQGYGATVNRGFAEAEGAYLAIVEPDDYLLPHMYDELLKMARYYTPGLGAEADGQAAVDADAARQTLAAAGPDIVKSAYWRVTYANTWMEEVLHCGYWSRIRPPRQPFKLTDVPNLLIYHPSIWSALYRKQFITDKQIRFREVPGAGWVDNPFLIETLGQADRIVYTDRAYYCYREFLPGSSSVGKGIDLLELERWNDMRDLLDELDISDDGVRQALTRRAINGLAAMFQKQALKDPEKLEAIKQTCARLRPEDVACIDNAQPGVRALILKLGGHEVRSMSRTRYLRLAVSEFLLHIRIHGIGHGLRKVFLYLWRWIRTPKKVK